MSAANLDICNVNWCLFHISCEFIDFESLIINDKDFS